MKVDFSREVNCPQELAFAYYSDRDKDLEWWQGTVSTTLTSKVRGGVGETNRQVQKYYGLPLTTIIDVEVIEWEPPHRWREICSNGYVNYDVWYVVEKLDERRSRVRLQGEAKFRGIVKWILPLAKGLLIRQSEANFVLLKKKLDALGAPETSEAPRPAWA